MVDNTKFICEFTTNHMGNLNILLEMVKQASKTGADFIKMQKKDIESFYSKEKLDSLYKSPYGKTYRDYREIFEFKKRDFDIFNDECLKYDIEWFATAQDFASLKFLLDYNLSMYKIASCNSDNIEFLRDCSKEIPSGKTVVVSCAGRDLASIENIISIFSEHNIIINHCVAEYPCSDENLRLGNIKVLRDTFGSDRVKIGYSGHEEGFSPVFSAIELGAEFIEKHFCLSRDSFVHHIECSLEPYEFKKMVDESKFVKHGSSTYCKKIDQRALSFKMGMSKMEEAFLKNNKYGSDFLKDVGSLSF